jgi:hypothetical protein
MGKLLKMPDERTKRFRIVIDGFHQPGGTDTLEEAERLFARQFQLGKHFQIYDTKLRIYSIPGQRTASLMRNK